MLIFPLHIFPNKSLFFLFQITNAFFFFFGPVRDFHMLSLFPLEKKGDYFPSLSPIRPQSRYKKNWIFKIIIINNNLFFFF